MPWHPRRARPAARQNGVGEFGKGQPFRCIRRLVLTTCRTRAELCRVIQRVPRVSNGKTTRTSQRRGQAEGLWVEENPGRVKNKALPGQSLGTLTSHPESAPTYCCWNTHRFPTQQRSTLADTPYRRTPPQPPDRLSARNGFHQTQCNGSRPH